MRARAGKASRRGPFVVTVEGDLVLVHLTHALKQKEPATENIHAVAFFRGGCGQA